MSRILVIDDEATICWAFGELLREQKHEVDCAASINEALHKARANRPDVVVLDVRLPDGDGIAGIAQLRQHVGAAPIVVMTAFGNLETAVRAVEAGAFDYLAKPFDIEEASAVVARALELALIAPAGPAKNDATPADDEIVGVAPAMQDVFKRIAMVAATDASVLITGETGTGKELVARAIHRHSLRRDGPFLPVCLAALSPALIESELFGHVKGSFTDAAQDRRGLFELTAGGTVFLDEIADTPLPVQVKLLRAIERREITPVGDARSRPINVRMLAATNQPLRELVTAGQFRDDLYFRLCAFQIELPPLRARRDDIPLLARHFLNNSALGTGSLGFSDATLAELTSRPWPGNVRELRHAVEHAAILARGGPIQPHHLPAVAAANNPLSAEDRVKQAITEWAAARLTELADESTDTAMHERLLELIEPPLLQAALLHCDHRRIGAAQLLGLHRATLREKLRRYGLDD